MAMDIKGYRLRFFSIFLQARLRDKAQGDQGREYSAILNSLLFKILLQYSAKQRGKCNTISEWREKATNDKSEKL